MSKINFDDLLNPPKKDGQAAIRQASLSTSTWSARRLAPFVVLPLAALTGWHLVTDNGNKPPAPRPAPEATGAAPPASSMASANPLVAPYVVMPRPVPVPVPPVVGGIGARRGATNSPGVGHNSSAPSLAPENRKTSSVEVKPTNELPGARLHDEGRTPASKPANATPANPPATSAPHLGLPSGGETANISDQDNPKIARKITG